MLSVQKLRNIFEKENISRQAYSFSGSDVPLLETALFMQVNNKGVFEVFSSERGVESKLKSFQSEDAACKFFLLIMSTGYRRLKKYLPLYHIESIY